MIRNANGDVLEHRRTQKDCICKRGKERDNCTKCEGTGKVILFRMPKGAVIVAENKPAHTIPAYVMKTCEHPMQEIATCGSCHRSWCAVCDPAPAALCHWCHGRGQSFAPRNKPEDASGVRGVPDWMMKREHPKFEGAPAEFLTTESMQAEHDLTFGLQAKAYAIGGKFPIGSVGDAIARRRGTGPKACIKKFLEAFDAWDRYVDYHNGDFDGMSYEELGKLATLEADMHKARAEVRGVMGLG